MGFKSLAQIPARRNRPVSLYVRPHILKTVPRQRKQKNESELLLQSCRLLKNVCSPRAYQAARNKLPCQEAARGTRNQEQRSYVSTHQRPVNNYRFSFRSCPTEVISFRGWCLAPACRAAQSVLRRGPSCAMPLHRLVWAALNLHRHSGLHQPISSAGSMKTGNVSLSFAVRRPKW